MEAMTSKNVAMYKIRAIANNVADITRTFSIHFIMSFYFTVQSISTLLFNLYLLYFKRNLKQHHGLKLLKRQKKFKISAANDI